MSPLSKIIVAIIISGLYAGLNWVLVLAGGALSFHASFTYGPQALAIGFIVTIIVAALLFVLYLLLIFRLIRTKKEKLLSHIERDN